MSYDSRVCCCAAYHALARSTSLSPSWVVITVIKRSCWNCLTQSCKCLIYSKKSRIDEGTVRFCNPYATMHSPTLNTRASPVASILQQASLPCTRCGCTDSLWLHRRWVVHCLEPLWRHSTRARLVWWRVLLSMLWSTRPSTLFCWSTLY
jgi:hypothetical protein